MDHGSVKNEYDISFWLLIVKLLWVCLQNLKEYEPIIFTVMQIFMSLLNKKPDYNPPSPELGSSIGFVA